MAKVGDHPNILKVWSVPNEDNFVVEGSDWSETGTLRDLLQGEKTFSIELMDGTFLNAEIIKQGYGVAYTKFSFKYLEEFRRYEREARENRKGLWK